MYVVTREWWNGSGDRGCNTKGTPNSISLETEAVRLRHGRLLRCRLVVKAMKVTHLAAGFHAFLSVFPQPDLASVCCQTPITWR